MTPSQPMSINTFSSMFALGIYLFDMTYIDSAYPASDSIIETEQRTNQMNNLLRIISDLQVSCNYGTLRSKKHIHFHFITLLFM